MEVDSILSSLQVICIQKGMGPNFTPSPRSFTYRAIKRKHSGDCLFSSGDKGMTYFTDHSAGRKALTVMHTSYLHVNQSVGLLDLGKLIFIQRLLRYVWSWSLNLQFKRYWQLTPPEWEEPIHF